MHQLDSYYNVNMQIPPAPTPFPQGIYKLMLKYLING